MNNHRRLQMQFEFINPQKLTNSVQKKPKPVQPQPKPLVAPTASNYVCKCVKVRPKIEITDQLVWKIEQQVKQQQQIVDEWDKEFERMRMRELEMQRTDLIRELDTLIAISNNNNA
jgi:hypothetical protein